MKEAGMISRELFESGQFPAESVLLSIKEHAGIETDSEDRHRLLRGMSRASGLRGALTGGTLGLGLRFDGNLPMTPGRGTTPRYPVFIETFEERFGSLNCSELLGCDIGTEDGVRYFRTTTWRKNLYEHYGGTAGMVM